MGGSGSKKKPPCKPPICKKPTTICKKDPPDCKPIVKAVKPVKVPESAVCKAPPEAPYKIPHYSTFKVPGHKPLEDLQSALSKLGMRDPWIRNEVWRYHKGFGTRGSRAWALWGRGIPLGFLLALGVTLGLKFTEDDQGHHGHH